MSRQVLRYRSTKLYTKTSRWLMNCDGFSLAITMVRSISHNDGSLGLRLALLFDSERRITLFPAALPRKGPARREVSGLVYLGFQVLAQLFCLAAFGVRAEAQPFNCHVTAHRT